MAEVHPKSAKTVTVACKIPGGLILRLFEPHKEKVAGLSGYSDVMVSREVPGSRVVLNGPARSWAMTGKMPDYQIIGGYALTPGVDAEFWEKWLDQNKEADYVRNRLVFAQAQQESAASQAKELKDVRSNLEPLDVSMVERGGRKVNADPRSPRGVEQAERA